MAYRPAPYPPFDDVLKKLTPLDTPAQSNRAQSLDLPMSPEWYADLTRSQRLLAFFLYMMNGNCVRPSEYAKRVGITRFSVYRMLRLLSQMGIPVVQESYGRWILMKFMPKTTVFDELR